jgi:hypothetical protein
VLAKQTMQRSRHVHAIDREAFLHAFAQAVGRVRMFALQPLRPLHIRAREGSSVPVGSGACAARGSRYRHHAGAGAKRPGLSVVHRREKLFGRFMG